MAYIFLLYIVLILTDTSFTFERRITYNNTEGGRVKPTIHKCHCGQTEIYDGRSCKKSFEELSTEIFLEPQILECPNGTRKVTLNADSFHLTPAGRIAILGTDLQMERTTFCLEYSLNESGEIVPIAEVCLPQLYFASMLLSRKKGRWKWKLSSKRNKPGIHYIRI